MSGVLGSPETQALAAVSEPKRLPRWAYAALGTAGLLAAIAITWYAARATARTEPPRFQQISFQQGDVTGARFLPDGQGIVCSSRWGSEQGYALYTGRLDSPGLRPLGVTTDRIESVSSSGEILILQNYHNVGSGYAAAGTLARVPLGGGAPRAVMENVQYADWTPDGSSFLIVRYSPEKRTYRLEYPVGNVLYETTGWIGDPRFSRDGEKIAYLDHPIFGDGMGYAAVTDLKGNRTQLSGSYGSTQGLAWSPNGNEIWYGAIEQGLYRSMLAATLSGRVRPILGAPGNIDVQDALPDGRVLVDSTSERHVLMVSTPEHPEPRDFTWMDRAAQMRFSVDGKELLFGDEHLEHYGTFLRNLDGSPAVRLGDGDPVDLSADGQWALSRVPTSPPQFMLLPTGTGEPRLLTHSDIQHLSARFLPDGKIIESASEPGRRHRALLLDLSGKETPITPEGVAPVALTPDGKQILTHSDATGEYELYPVMGGEPKGAGLHLQPGEIVLDYAGDGAAVLIDKTVQEAVHEIWRVDLGSGKRTLLHRVTPGAVPAVTIALYDQVSRDGQSFAYIYGQVLSTEYVVTGIR